MDDEGLRLSELVRELTESGRGKPLPIVTHDDADTIVGALHDEMDAATQARDSFAAENDLVIACEEGCDACCVNMIIVFEPEAIAVATWLARPENRDARESFLDAYPRWREGVGDVPERLAKLEAGGNLEEYETLLGDVWRKGVMCAFNRQGSCTIYPVRPNVCRGCHALDTSEHCSSDTDERPDVISFPALDDFMKRTRPLVYAVHVGVCGAYAGPSSLCDAVHRLLRDDSRVTRGGAKKEKVGRNSPCPCGSGKKYKRCCGA